MLHLRAGQHQVHRGKAPRGVLGVLTNRTDRRGEAHLWLLLEESLVAVAAAGAREVERNFRCVAEALSSAGAVPPLVADAISRELSDALAVRGYIGLSRFEARHFPVQALEAPCRGHDLRAEVWLETEIERHLDLLSRFEPAARSGAGKETLRILSGPVRALAAAGVLGAGHAMVDDLGASLTAAGFGPVATASPGVARPEWVRVLYAKPDGPPGGDEGPARSLDIRLPLGDAAGCSVMLTGLHWSEDTLEVGVSVARPAAGGRPPGVWSARALDDRGRLHLGQPRPMVAGAGSALRFELRPGLHPAVLGVHLRITTGGDCVEGEVAL